MIPKLIWRNLWRNKRRTAITIFSVAFALVFAILMQSLQKGIFGNLIKNVVEYHSGYIQIHAKGYWDEQIIDNCFEFNDTLENKLGKNQDIPLIIPRIESFLLISKADITKGCMIIGTDAERENQLSNLKSKISKGNYFSNTEEVVILSQGLANRINSQVGDTVVLFGQGYQGTIAAGKYRVKGIVHLASPDMNDALVYMPLTSAQKMLGAENRITSISLGISDKQKISSVKENIGKLIGSNYEVMDWEEMMPQIANHIKIDGVTFYIYSGILYLIIGFGFFGTILMMTTERRREFGMLVAIGMQKKKLAMVLFGESIMISLIGVLAGIAISFPIVLNMEQHPLRFGGEIAAAYERFGFEAIFPTIVSAEIFITQSLIVMTMALLIGLYPLWNIARLNPLNALKK